MENHMFYLMMKYYMIWSNLQKKKAAFLDFSNQKTILLCFTSKRYGFYKIKLKRNNPNQRWVFKSKILYID